MPPKTKKVRETFNALGVTGGAPKFKQHVKSARKPTSWERKALKAAKTNEPVQSESNPNVVKAQPRAPDRQTKKTTRITKSDFQHPQRSLDLSSSSSSGSADDSSDDSSSNEEQIDLQPKSKGASAAVLLKPKRSKKERIVSITFEHFPVQERDFHGISGLLSNFLGGFEYHSGDLADLCISVGDMVGSVQKVDEGSDALGILSCVNMHAHSKRPSIQAISSTLLRRCPKEKHSKVQSLISSPSTALVVSSRILNVPDALALPLWKNLLEEVSVAQKLGKSEYQVTTLLLLCPVVACEDGSPFYMRGEEEVFCANADLQFSFQGALAGHTVSAVFLSVKNPNSVLKQVLDGVGDAAIPGFTVPAK